MAALTRHRLSGGRHTRKVLAADARVFPGTTADAMSGKRFTLSVDIPSPDDAPAESLFLSLTPEEARAVVAQWNARL